MSTLLKSPIAAAGVFVATILSLVLLATQLREESVVESLPKTNEPPTAVVSQHGIHDAWVDPNESRLRELVQKIEALKQQTMRED